MATNKKAVLVTMYVEKPRRLLATNGHHHHHHHVHHTIKREVIHYRHGDAGKRYINRRAELLQYSQRLRRTPARQPAFSPLISKQNSPNHQQTMSQALPVQRKARDERTPACFANCNAMVPNFFRLLASPQDKKERNKKNKKQHSGSTSNKIQAMMKSLEVKKKKGFISKLLSTFQKRR